MQADQHGEASPAESSEKEDDADFADMLLAELDEGGADADEDPDLAKSMSEAEEALHPKLIPQEAAQAVPETDSPSDEAKTGAPIVEAAQMLPDQRTFQGLTSRGSRSGPSQKQPTFQAEPPWVAPNDRIASRTSGTDPHEKQATALQRPPQPATALPGLPQPSTALPGPPQLATALPGPPPVATEGKLPLPPPRQTEVSGRSRACDAAKGKAVGVHDNADNVTSPEGWQSWEVEKASRVRKGQKIYQVFPPYLTHINNSPRNANT